jgi:hypothetical protein
VYVSLMFCQAKKEGAKEKKDKMSGSYLVHTSEA